MSARLVEVPRLNLISNGTEYTAQQNLIDSKPEIVDVPHPRIFTEAMRFRVLRPGVSSRLSPDVLRLRFSELNRVHGFFSAVSVMALGGYRAQEIGRIFCDANTNMNLTEWLSTNRLVDCVKGIRSDGVLRRVEDIRERLVEEGLNIGIPTDDRYLQLWQPEDRTVAMYGRRVCLDGNDRWLVYHQELGINFLHEKSLQNSLS